MQNKNILLATGMFMLVLTIAIDRFIVRNGVTDFTVGVFLGLSLVLNTFSIFQFRKKQK